MISAGFTSVDVIASYAQEEDLMEALLISEEEARDIIAKAKTLC